MPRKSILCDKDMEPCYRPDRMQKWNDGISDTSDWLKTAR